MRIAMFSVAGVLVLLAAGSAEADCRFATVQDVDIHSTHWNDVLIYNYTTMIPVVAGPVFGNRTAPYTPIHNNWHGAFVYDYLLQQYVQAQYSYIESI